MKIFLIALDYSPSAKRVAETGYRLAKAMKGQAILLHVISDSTYYASLNYSPIMGFEGFSNLIASDNAEELKKAAQNYLNKSKQHLDDDSIQTVVKNGVFGETILKTATELDANIIVMGTHSRRGLEKILVGSVAENVLHHSSIPILIIPNKALEQ